MWRSKWTKPEDYFFRLNLWIWRHFASFYFRLAFAWFIMRGDRRSSSFHKEKPTGLYRAFSWLNVSSLSLQSKRIFHSQSELHNSQKHSHSHTYLHAADRDEDEDNWVYQPQHKIGEGGRTKETLHCRGVLLCCFTSFWKKTPSKPRGVCLGCPTTASQCWDFVWMFFCSQPGNQWITRFTRTSRARSGSQRFYGPLYAFSTSSALPACFRVNRRPPWSVCQRTLCTQCVTGSKQVMLHVWRCHRVVAVWAQALGP